MHNWAAIAKRAYYRFNEDRVMTEAAAVTYYALLALFPAIAALISLYGLIADPLTVAKNLGAVAAIVPGGGMDVISGEIRSLTSAPTHTLGLGALAGLLVSVWSASTGVKSLFDALNAVFRTPETRGFFYRTWLSLTFTVGFLVFVILTMSAVVAIPAILSFVGLGWLDDLLIRLGRWPILLCAVMLFLALTYRFGPSARRPGWRWLSPGVGFATFIWLLTSAVFSYYVANFGSYNRTYGSLGAVAGFMTWIWLSSTIILVGAEVDEAIEEVKKKDVLF